MSSLLLFLTYVFLIILPQLHALTVPSWSDLENSHLASSTTSLATCTLYRERNGWCIYSARLWLALEMKNIPYDTVLLDSKYDTYDGSVSDFKEWPSNLDDDTSLP